MTARYYSAAPVDESLLDDAFSPTAIDTFDLCCRKWGWRKLDKIEMPSNDAAEFGNEVHAQQEAWLKYGKPLDLTTRAGALAMHGLPYLPLPGTPGMQVEEWFYMAAWGHTIRGKKDVFFATEIPCVIDHKTTSNLIWAKTADDLETDIQACVYAADAMIKTGSNYCDLRWLYYQKSKPHKVLPVDVRLSREQIAPTLLRIQGLVLHMAAIQNTPGISAKHLPYNIQACEKYGGCAYKEHCNLSPEEQYRAIMLQQHSFQAQKAQFLQNLEQLQQQQGGAGMSMNPPQQQPQQWAPPPNQGPMTQGGQPAHPGWGPPPQSGPPMGQQSFQQPQQPQGAPPPQFQQPGPGPQAPPMNQQTFQQQQPPSQFQQQQFQQPNGAPPPQFQQPGPQGAPPPEQPAARGGRPKGSRNKKNNPAPPVVPQQQQVEDFDEADAYEMIGRGFMMLAAIRRDEE